MKKVKKNHTSTIFYNKNSVRKDLTNSQFSKNVYDHVKNLSDGKPYYTQLLDWHSNTSYSMERLDVLNTAQDCINDASMNIPLDVCLDLVNIGISVYTDTLEYSRKHLPKGTYLTYADARFKNFVITNEYQIKLIDLDSFTLSHDYVHWRTPGFFTEIFMLLNKKIQDAKDV